MAKKIDGKAVAEEVHEQVKREVDRLERKGINAWSSGCVIVGDDPASRTYVNNKKKACEKVGIYSEEYGINKLS